MHDDSPNARTLLDPGQAPKRLREGLVPGNTGIFLRVEHGSDRGAVADLSSGGVYVIGREDADLALHDVKISRRHAEIGLYGPGAFVLRDLASTNGTRVNGRRIADRHKLASGDLIEVGDTAIRFTVVENAIRPS
jgi:pSer/pThr/pTyr-binding forkhead associated (FHA) protein